MKLGDVRLILSLEDVDFDRYCDRFIKGVCGCNLELFQSDVDPCFHRRQLGDN